MTVKAYRKPLSKIAKKHDLMWELIYTMPDISEISDYEDVLIQWLEEMKYKTKANISFFDNIIPPVEEGEEYIWQVFVTGADSKNYNYWIKRLADIGS